MLEYPADVFLNDFVRFEFFTCKIIKSTAILGVECFIVVLLDGVIRGYRVIQKPRKMHQ
jgi:hypothetical protein